MNPLPNRLQETGHVHRRTGLRKPIPHPQQQSQRTQRTQAPQQAQEKPNENLIQSNSVQNQFTSLSNDRDKFRNEREAAENELEVVTAVYRELKKENDDLAKNKNFHAKAELGEQSKKLRMLQEEQDRIKRLIENESRALVECTKRIKALETKKEDAKKKLVVDLSPINSEIHSLLLRRLQKKVTRFISVKTVEEVVVPKLFQGDSNAIPKGFKTTIEKLKNETSSRDEAILQLRKRTETIRRNGMNINDIVNRAQRYGNEDVPKHMDLFYGPEI
jgi:DNA repair exonuclease SbcCD ATPase subunit